MNADTGATLSKLSPELDNTEALATFYNREIKLFKTPKNTPLFFDKKDLEDLFLMENIERHFHQLQYTEKTQSVSGRPIDVKNSRPLIEKLRKKDIDLDECIMELSKGYGLKVFSAHIFSSILKKFAHELFFLFDKGININIYIMASGEKKGYDLHTDVGAYFIKQISGEKEWYFPLDDEGQPLKDYQGLLGRNDARKAFEKSIINYKSFTIQEGDCLHFPLGCPHYAISRSEEFAVHLTVAIHEYRAMDFINFASEYMLKNRLRAFPFQGISEKAWEFFFEDSNEEERRNFREQWKNYLLSKNLFVLKKGIFIGI